MLDELRKGCTLPLQIVIRNFKVGAFADNNDYCTKKIIGHASNEISLGRNILLNKTFAQLYETI